MQDKDSDILFEMYQKIYEAPIGPGSSWDDEVDIDPGQSERLSRKQYGEIGEEDVRLVIQNIKAFLQEHEGSVYPGSMSDLKTEIKVIIQDTVEGVNATKAGYAARVIKNELERLNIVEEIPDGEQVHVGNVNNIQEIEDEIEDTLGVDGDDSEPQTKPAVVLLSGEYRVERDEIPLSASQEAKDAYEALLKAGMAFNTHTGKDIIKATGLPYSKAKTIIAELMEIGLVHLPEKDDSGEDRIVDVGDEDEDYDDAVSGEYEKLRRDIYGGESPVMRPDDF